MLPAALGERTSTPWAGPIATLEQSQRQPQGWRPAEKQAHTKLMRSLVRGVRGLHPDACTPHACPHARRNGHEKFLWACGHVPYPPLVLLSHDPSPLPPRRYGDQLRAIEGCEILESKLRQVEEAEAFHVGHEKGLGDTEEHGHSAGGRKHSQVKQ